MAYTPLGYLNIGPLAVTFNVIPVAVCAIVLGPTGGAIAGAVFGLTSFMQAIGIGGVSALGSALFQINPFMTAVQCFGPRIPDQLCISKHHNQRSHKEQCIQKCRKEPGNSTGYIRICLFVNSSVNESNTDTIKNTRSKTLYRRHKRIDLKQSRSGI